MRRRIERGLWVGAVVASMLLLPAAMEAARPSNKWRLHFRGHAYSDGTIVISILPVGADPIEASIEIEGGTRENMVAKAVVVALKKQLPEGLFSVWRDDGEEVVIKRIGGSANFDLKIVSNDVKGVRINPNRA